MSDIEQRAGGNPYGYERSWTIEQHRDELIERLGNAIKAINELEQQRDALLKENEGLKNDWKRLNRVFKTTSDKTIDQNMEIERLKKHNVDLSKRLGKPRCLDCNAVHMSNCAHFDECGGIWKYELEDQVEQLQQRIGELEQDSYSVWRREFEAGEILLYGWTSDQIKSALRQYQSDSLTSSG